MELLEGAKIASYAAGKFLLSHLHEIKEVMTKSNAFDLVTKFDKDAEEIFFTYLERYFPDIPFFSEESGKLWTGKKNRFWVIDPLDGTTNYVKGIPMFATSLALVEDGKPILGVIYDPARDEMFWAEKGKGAYLNGSPIKVSSHRELLGAILSTTFSHESILRKKNSAYFQYLYKYAQSIRAIGTSALSLAYTAAGRFDAYWTFSVSLWDIAAGAILVKEAKGEYSTLSIRERDFLELTREKTISFLGANDSIFPSITHVLFTNTDRLEELDHS